jgi:hypothetical protein
MGKEIEGFAASQGIFKLCTMNNMHLMVVHLLTG